MRSEKEFLLLVEEKLSAAEPIRRPRGVRASLMVATALLLSAAVIGGMVWLNREPPTVGHEIVDDTVPEERTLLTNGETIAPPIVPETVGTLAAIETGMPETWNKPDIDLPVPGSLQYDGRDYVLAQRTAFSRAEVTLGAALGNGLYALDGVTSAYYLLKEEDGGLWGYRSYDYRPATLGTLMQELNLAQTLQFGDMHYHGLTDGAYRSWRIEGLSSAQLWTMLFANPDAMPERLTVKIDPEAIRDAAAQGGMVAPPYDPTGQYIVDRVLVADLSIGISLPQFGLHNISIMLSREGWLWTNILSSGNYFAVSPTLVDDLLAYAESNGVWVDTTPDISGTEIGVPEIGYAEPVTAIEETVTHSVTQEP